MRIRIARHRNTKIRQKTAVFFDSLSPLTESFVFFCQQKMERPNFIGVRETLDEFLEPGGFFLWRIVAVDQFDKAGAVDRLSIDGHVGDSFDNALVQNASNRRAAHRFIDRARSKKIPCFIGIMFFGER